MPLLKVPPKLVHIDKHVIVAVKPAGLLAVPGRGADKQDCLSARLAAEFGEIHIVHRLDQATSGVMVFARTLAALRDLHAQFRTGMVDKAYEAIVAGNVASARFTIDAPIGKDWVNRPLQKIDFKEGKPSKTELEVMNRETDNTRVALIPHTGRTHQLRLHMMHIKHPILGDKWYGDKASAPRLLLHAKQISFLHPSTQKKMVFESKPDF